MMSGIHRSTCLTPWRMKEEEEEKTLVSSSKALTRFSSLYRPLLDVACKKNGILGYSCTVKGLLRLSSRFVVFCIVFSLACYVMSCCDKWMCIFHRLATNLCPLI